MPEKTFMTAAVASATPSIMPTVTMEAPSTLTINTGRRLWISSEEASMNSEPNPNAQMPAGKARQAADVLLGDCGLFEGGECMCRVSVGGLTLELTGGQRVAKPAAGRPVERLVGHHVHVYSASNISGCSAAVSGPAACSE